MTDTPVIDSREAGGDGWGAPVDQAGEGYVWGRCASDSDADFWAPLPAERSELGA